MSWIFILDHYTCNEHSINVSLSMSCTSFSTVYCFGFQFYHIKLPHCITLFDNAINQKRRVLLHVSILAKKLKLPYDILILTWIFPCGVEYFLLRWLSSTYTTAVYSTAHCDENEAANGTSIDGTTRDAWDSLSV